MYRDGAWFTGARGVIQWMSLLALGKFMMRASGRHLRRFENVYVFEDGQEEVHKVRRFGNGLSRGHETSLIRSLSRFGIGFGDGVYSHPIVGDAFFVLKRPKLRPCADDGSEKSSDAPSGQNKLMKYTASFSSEMQHSIAYAKQARSR